MRVISGSLKGKPINYLKNSITRPLKDIVKEGFNTLKHSNLINAEIKFKYSGHNANWFIWNRVYFLWCS